MIAQFLLAQYANYAITFLSTKNAYIVPEVAGTCFTHQNDRESLLYTLVGPKMRLIEVNVTACTDL